LRHRGMMPVALWPYSVFVVLSTSSAARPHPAGRVVCTRGHHRLDSCRRCWELRLYSLANAGPAAGVSLSAKADHSPPSFLRRREYPVGASRPARMRSISLHGMRRDRPILTLLMV